ncbi:hypothetical protein [Paenibacillus xylanexedens]|uniref:hypothetical protein n=1 Tax=Paenibacillus xylanexedens TaxID=528191 RepID=UPI000F52876E|nr:hypothetical protein [Paenibacillus xylanexedens]
MVTMMPVAPNAPLAVKLNSLGNEYVTLEQLHIFGVKLKAATTRLTSFFGIYLGVRVHGYYCKRANRWKIERA